MAYILLYVDDIILIASDNKCLQWIIASLKTKFFMTDMGKLSYFLSIKAVFNSSGLFLSQEAYASDVIKHAGMIECKLCATPVDLKAKLSVEVGDLVPDPAAYRILAGALQYLTFTRPEISYGVNQICLFMHSPRQPHLQALKRIIRYIQGTKSQWLQFVKGPIDTLTAYSNADWTGYPDTRESTSGYCVYLDSNLISWSSK